MKQAAGRSHDSSTLMREIPRRVRFDLLGVALFVVFLPVANYTIFRLPFRFPPKTRLVSASYIFGFNNAVSVACIVLLLGAAALVCLWRRRREAIHVAPAISFATD